MKIYWLFLIISVVAIFLDNYNYEVVQIGNHYEKRAKWLQAILFFGVIIFFCGLRSGIADTGIYIQMFKIYPSNINQIDWSADSKDKGFILFTALYKQFISQDYHGWLFFIALISGISIMIALKKHSSWFGMSCFLFVSSTMFTYFVNGIRQFICVSILFLCVGFIKDRKFWKYCIVVLLLSTIHASVLIMLPMYFVARTKPWSARMWLILGASIIIAIFFDQLFPIFGSTLENTQYGNYVDYIANEGVGSSVFRLLIAAVPCALAFVGRNIKKQEHDSIIDIAINMSIINLCLFIIATVSSGMAIGRLTIYFEMYNLLLLPWLIKNIFNSASSKIMVTLTVFFYTVFFYYQMVLTWNLGYESDILHLFIR